MTKLLVKNNEARIKGVDGKNGTIVLKPGLNQVEKEDIEVFSKHPLIKAEVEAGTLELPDLSAKDPKSDKTEDVIAPLLKLAPKAAKETITQTIDVELLTSWFAVEKRAEIKKAIEAQLEELNKSPEFRSDKTE